MSAYAYDPDNWLVSTHRAIQKWVADQLALVPALTDIVTVEMSFPDTSTWTKDMPLETVLVHFEQDMEDDVPLGMGQPGVGVYDDVAKTFELQEAQQHELNFDVGVWVSAEMGGATKRMEAMQALKNLFTSVYGIAKFNADTEGLNVVSFTGGRNQLDRINDVPVWRGMDMALIVRVFSRHLPSAPTQVPDQGIDMSDGLTITTADGTTEPVTTP